MTDSGKGVKDASALQLEQRLLAQIEVASCNKMITSEALRAELAQIEAEIRRLCQARENDKAKRLTELAVALVRTGEASKE